MLADAQHAEGRRGSPGDEEALVAEGEVEEVGELAVDDGDKDGVLSCGMACWVCAVTENQAQGVGRLVPRAATFVRRGGEVVEARGFVG